MSHVCPLTGIEHTFPFQKLPESAVFEGHFYLTTYRVPFQLRWEGRNWTVICGGGGVRGCHSQAQSVAGREPVQAGNPVPVSAGSPGGGITVHQPLPFHYTGQFFSPAPCGSGVVRCRPWPVVVCPRQHPGVLLCLHRLSHLKNSGEQLITPVEKSYFFVPGIMKHARWNGCNKGVDF
jgi:hypothetical protein